MFTKKIVFKTLGVLIAVALLLALLPGAVLADDPPVTLTMELQSGGDVYCGPEVDTTTVDIKVAGLPESPGLQAYHVALSYDPDQVTIADESHIVNGDVLQGELLSGEEGKPPHIIHNENGTAVLIFVVKGAATSLQSGTLVSVTFTHVGNPEKIKLGFDPVDVDPTMLVDDYDMLPIPIDSLTGITITREMAIVQNVDTLAYYCDLGEAVTEATAGDTLNVLRNFAVDATVDITKELEFNTDIYTVSFTPTSGNYTPILWVKGGGDLTITGTGTLNSSYEGDTKGAAVRVSEGGDLELDGPTLMGGYSSLRIDGNIAPGGDERDAIGSTFTLKSGTLYDGLIIFGKGAEATIDGGLVTSQPGGFAPISGNGTNNASGNFGGTRITINGGFVYSGYDAAIFHPQDGDLTITGGMVTGATGIIMKSGNLDISGGSHICANGEYAEPEVAGSGQNSTGDAILIYSGTGYTGDITVNIHITEYKDDPSNFGQLTSEWAYAIREFSDTTTATRTSSVKISSGAIQSVFGDWHLPTSENILFTETLRNNALTVVPNDTLLLTGGWYNMDPAYYVFPPLETYPEYEVPGDTESAYGFRIREMYPFAVTHDSEETLYPTLADAIDAVESGDTITLRLDHTDACSVPIPAITTDVTFDMNGFAYVWPCAQSNYDAPLVLDTGGELTIKDSSADETGSIFSTDGVNDSKGAAVNVTGGEATLESGTLKGAYTSVRVAGNILTGGSPKAAEFTVKDGTVYNGIVILGQSAVLNVEGGLVTSQTGGFAPITGNGTVSTTYDCSGTEINISGGQVGMTEMIAIYHPQDGVLNISGLAEIRGTNGIEMKAGILNITGHPDSTFPMIEATGIKKDPDLTSSGSTDTGDAILLYSRDGYTGTINVNISGGTIGSDYAYALREYVAPGETSRVGTIKISDNVMTGVPMFVSGWEFTHPAVFFTTVNETQLQLTGGYYSTDPAEYVFLPLETYLVTDFPAGFYHIRRAFASVVGTVSMQGRTTRAGVPFTLTGDLVGFGPYPATSLNVLGTNLTFPSVAVGGEYTVTTLQERYLNITEDMNKTFNLMAYSYEMNPLRLLGGNAVWKDPYTGELDNAIDISDAGFVGGAYGGAGSTEPTGENNADVNFDGKVNIQDLALVGGNFGLDSKEAYKDWTP